MRRLLVAVLFLTSACATWRGGMSDGELLSQDPVVNPMPGEDGSGEGASGREDAEAERKLTQARDAYLRGEYGLCLTIVREALEKSPPHGIADELRGLRFEAKRRQLEKDVVAARVLPEREVYAMGDEVVLQLTVLNVADQSVKIVQRLKKASHGIFIVKVEREDRDVYGNVRSETTSHVVGLKADIDVPPGGRRSVSHTLPTSHPEDRHLGFTVLRISGTLRPAVILCGDEWYYTAVEMEEAEVRIFPPGFEPLAEDSLDTLDKAYGLGAREHLLVAAELAPPERRGEVVGKLISYLDGPETGTWVTVMAALKRLTGREFDGKASAWVAWWREEGRHEVH